MWNVLNLSEIKNRAKIKASKAFQKKVKNKRHEEEEQWNLNPYGLEVGSSVWCSRGWFQIVRIEDPNRVFVIPERSNQESK